MHFSRKGEETDEFPFIFEVQEHREIWASAQFELRASGLSYSFFPSVIVICGFGRILLREHHDAFLICSLHNLQHLGI
jgi:hypothetical protein